MSIVTRGQIRLLAAGVALALAAGLYTLAGAPRSGVSAQESSERVKVTAQKTSPPDAVAKSTDDLKRSAARYRIAMATEPPKELSLEREPVLLWTNPQRKTVASASFVWVADGRPEAIASIYRFNEAGKMVEDNEFQSLASTGLTATRDGQPAWAPRSAGVSFAPIPGAPKPAASPADRLRQMRALAREFHAFFNNAPEDQSELRLLPQPLYRYQTNRPELLDGALFAFVVTTDPEVLLLLEARPVEKAPTWHYAFARMSMVNLRAEHKGQDVWSVQWAYNLQDRTQPYLTLRAPSEPN
jgi:hypothetical protein